MLLAINSDWMRQNLFSWLITLSAGCPTNGSGTGFRRGNMSKIHPRPARTRPQVPPKLHQTRPNPAQFNPIQSSLTHPDPTKTNPDRPWFSVSCVFRERRPTICSPSSSEYTTIWEDPTKKVCTRARPETQRGNSVGQRSREPNGTGFIPKPFFKTLAARGADAGTCSPGVWPPYSEPTGQIATIFVNPGDFSRGGECW